MAIFDVVTIKDVNFTVVAECQMMGGNPNRPFTVRLLKARGTERPIFIVTRNGFIQLHEGAVNSTLEISEARKTFNECCAEFEIDC